DLKQFFFYLSSMYDIADPAAVTHSMIRSWIVDLMDKEISPRSVNRKLTTLKTFYKFLLRQGKITSNPMIKVQSPKTSKRLPVFVEESKMDLLFEADNFGDEFEDVRDKLMLEIFYSTGMRLSELINLREQSIDIFQSQVKV